MRHGFLALCLCLCAGAAQAAPPSQLLTLPKTAAAVTAAAAPAANAAAYAYDFNVAYWPYYHKIQVTVNLNVPGLDPTILAAPQYDVTLFNAGSKELAKQGGKFVEKTDNTGKLIEKDVALVMNVPDLPAGDYMLKLRLLDANGGVIDYKVAKLTREIYPWEHNKLGTARIVIPPYTPIKVQGQTLSVWGRDLEIGPGGLPDKITDQGENILDAPMRLEAVVDGKPQVWTPVSAHVTTTAPDRVEVQGTAQVAGAPVTISAFLEYDGWYQLAIKLGTSAATVDSLDLVIPMTDKADTVDMMRFWLVLDQTRFAGNIPPGNGVVWESSQLKTWRNFQGWGSFVPQMFIGNGDRGLWVLAPNQEDWVLNDKRSTVTLERVDGKPQLRIRFIAGTTALDTPRLLDLIFLPEPVKPLPKDWRSWAWAYPTAHYIHDEDGYRYYGAQLDGYTLPGDDDFVKLASIINGKPWFAGNKEIEARPGPSVKQRAHDFPNEPIALYASGWKVGASDDFHTFAGEWAWGNSEWVGGPENQYKDSWNAQRTIQWKTDWQNTVPWCNWPQSHMDQYVWYYEKYLRLAGINGTWWDDGGLSSVIDYDARRGKFVTQWWFLQRREVCKRLNVLCAQLGVQPLWISNQHADFSWSQIGWHIEEALYAFTDPGPKGYLGVLTPDQFRALTCTHGGIIPRLAPEYDAGRMTLTPDQRSHFFRTAYGMAALHGIGAYLNGKNGGGDENVDVANGNIDVDENRIRMMLSLVGWYSPDAEFIPYWRSQGFVHLQPKYAANGSPLLISVYRSAGHDKALLVLCNPSDKPAEFVCSWLYTIEASLLGHPIQQMVDAYTMDQLPNGGSIPVAPYDFRFVFLE